MSRFPHRLALVAAAVGLAAVCWPAAAVGLAASASAQLRRSIPVTLATGDVEAVVLVRAAPGVRGLVVEKAYLGEAKEGEVLSIDTASFQHDFDFTVEGTSLGDRQRFLLLLEQEILDTSLPGTIGGRWLLDQMVSKRIVGGQAYLWLISLTAAASPEEALIKDDVADLAGLETLIERGISLREQWATARDTENPAAKLKLLRPFFIPSAQTFDALFEVHELMPEALSEVEQTGRFGASFIRDLLNNPTFQPDYDADGQWLNFGRQHRQLLLQSLKKLES